MLSATEGTNQQSIVRHGGCHPLDHQFELEVSVVHPASPPSAHDAPIFVHAEPSHRFSQLAGDRGLAVLFEFEFGELGRIDGHNLLIIYHILLHGLIGILGQAFAIIGSSVPIPLGVVSPSEASERYGLVALHLFAEQSQRVELWPDCEHDLFLDAAVAQTAPSNEPVGEVYLDLPVEIFDAG